MRKALAGIIFLSVFSCAGMTEKNPCKNPEYAKIQKDKARNDIRVGDHYTALNDVLEAKRCNPRDPEVYFLLGQIYWYRQERDKAKENFETALKYNPRYSETYLALGDMFLEENNFEFALGYYQKAARDDLFREAYLAWNNIGWIYLQQDKLKEAEEAFIRALALRPDFALPHCNLGELYSRQKRYQEAIREYQKALQLDPNLARAHRLLGLEYNRQGRVKEACQEFNLALKSAPPESEEAKYASQYLELLKCPSSFK